MYYVCDQTIVPFVVTHRKYDHPTDRALPHHRGPEGNGGEDGRQLSARARVRRPAGHQDHHHLSPDSGGEPSDSVDQPREEQPGLCARVLAARYAHIPATPRTGRYGITVY